MLSYIDKRPLVAKGCTGPLVRPLEIAESVHGESGLDGPSIPDPTFGPQKESAWELSRKLILGSREPVTMVCTGPLTNLATLLIAYPEVKQNIRQVCLMGGGIDHGNWTTAAEFNILVDPEAADKVFSCGIPIVMCGLDVTEKAILSLDDIEEIRKMGGKVPVLVAGLLDFFSKFHLSMGFPGVPLHDPTTIAYLMRPELFTAESLYVQVETQGKLTTGMTFADKRTNPRKHQPNALVCTGIDREGFVRLVKECCLSYGSKVAI